MSRVSLQTPVVILNRILSYHKEKEFSHSIKATAVAIINPRAVSLAWGSTRSQLAPLCPNALLTPFSGPSVLSGPGTMRYCHCNSSAVERWALYTEV